GDTPAQLAEELIARFDSRVRESLLDPGTGTIDPAIQVMVNGKLIARDDLSGWIFREGDRVTFMKLLAGG
ncbi:MAG TPA: hypothetical protein VLS90_07575, partial [Thermodesulfobacteriota bacterium]|nr:hypothetical protein [Thermodesulfobacteriota bacterium]